MNVVACGVGGQGVLLACGILGRFALDSGQDCRMSEIHGMSQRGGSVAAHVRIGFDLHSPVVRVGEADVVLALEKLEGLRRAPYLAPDGLLLCSTREIMPASVLLGAREYPRDIASRLPKRSRVVDAPSLALRAGSEKTENVVMLGVLAASIGLDADGMRRALASCVRARTLDVNLRAFALGFESVAATE